MIVVCDINEIWRKNPFAALADQVDVLGVAPADWMVARRREFPVSDGRLIVLPVSLPPSWASRTSWFGQRLLRKRILKKCMERGQEIDCLVVTSPHYLPLLKLVPENVKTIYYASDDYRSYEGWGAVADKEQQLVEHVDHAFFISEGLKVRAEVEYGVDPARLSVSMNATELRFFPVDALHPCPVPTGDLRRPIAGVIGGIGDRLDFELMCRCADLDELGTLLLVGPLPEEPSAELQALLAHPKCVAVGAQPHAEIHRWFQCLDVGLIPYVKTEFNRLCSPMRLFDHLASGARVVATDACEQVTVFNDRVAACSFPEEFVCAVRNALVATRPEGRVEGITWEDRVDQMLKVMGGQGIV